MNYSPVIRSEYYCPLVVANFLVAVTFCLPFFPSDLDPFTYSSRCWWRYHRHLNDCSSHRLQRTTYFVGEGLLGMQPSIPTERESGPFLRYSLGIYIGVQLPRLMSDQVLFVECSSQTILPCICTSPFGAKPTTSEFTLSTREYIRMICLFVGQYRWQCNHLIETKKTSFHDQRPRSRFKSSTPGQETNNLAVKFLKIPEDSKHKRHSPLHSSRLNFIPHLTLLPLEQPLSIFST